MANIPEFNFPAFFHAAKKLEQEGHEVFNPANEDLKKWGNMECVQKNANYRDCMRSDLNWILDHAEAIAFLPGWEKGRGTKVEHGLAALLDLKFIYLNESYLPIKS